MVMMENQVNTKFLLQIPICFRTVHILRQPSFSKKILLEPSHKKNNNLGFGPGLTQTGMYSHRKELDAEKFGYK